MLALALALLTAPPSIPSDVTACIERRKMWVAAPEFFEALVLESGERAYQILDRHQGRTGYLLVTPDRCGIVVFIRPGEVLSVPEGARPTLAELRSVLQWAGYRERRGGKLGPRTFQVQGDALWIYGGDTAQLVDLMTGQVRRAELTSAR